MSEVILTRQHDHLFPHVKQEKEAAAKTVGQKPLDCYRIYDMVTLLLLFFLFCFIGWCWEVGIHIVVDHAFVNRGVMHGPWLPIYGAGGVLIIVLLRKLFGKPVVLFVFVMILCGIVEYGTHWYLETFKGLKYWDYSNKLLNLNGRICAEGLLVFGLGGCVIVYVAAPFFAGKLDLIRKPLKICLLAVLLVVFVIDFVYSRAHPNKGKGITDYPEDKRITGLANPRGAPFIREETRQYLIASIS